MKMKQILLGEAFWTTFSIFITGLVILAVGCQIEETASPQASSSSPDVSRQAVDPGAPENHESSTASISIENFTFNPREIFVAPGTTVTWTNQDDVPHTATAHNAEFTSGTLDTDDRFSHRFLTPGTFSYYCGVHPHMTAKVVVRDTPESR